VFTRHGVSGVTTQQVADRADVAIGTLYLYASTKAELLIMAQNAKFTDLRLKQPQRRMAFAHPHSRAPR
jgi:AcrR family transcriptional regulator